MPFTLQGCQYSCISKRWAAALGKRNFAPGETHYTQPTQVSVREGIDVAVIDFTMFPRCHGAGFREDGTTCDLWHGAGEIEVQHEAPDNRIHSSLATHG
jgi:hypothetical protein